MIFSMNKSFVWVAIIIILIGGGYWYVQSGKSDSATEATDMGTYPYQCATGEKFTMTPASDVASIKLTPGEGASFAETTLAFVSGDAGQRFEGSGIVFIGAGEGVALTVGSKTLNCNPVPNPDSPPWNWGDAGEGGGVKQDTALIVSESIVGTWQDTTDAKFSREFKADGTAVDSYEGKKVSSGTWVAFTKANPPEMLGIPLEESTVYIQMTMAGTQADKLNFKVAKLTPDELQLVYMDRGGVLMFKSVK
jgi:hypothetical protein